ncbi:ABC transporter ATP-binding protein [Infirmifilum sp. SLHALR2]|nr:MAG: hypothetical protein B7L53_04210 [Thermofilum sp. NZ13]
MSLVSVRSLSVSVGYRNFPVLKDISFSLEKGEALLVVGPTGAGKSTLLLTLSGVIPELVHGKVEGEVRVADHNPTEEGLKGLAGDVGIVFQDPEAQVVMETVFDEVAFPLENLRYNRDEITRRVEDALLKAGLTKYSSEETDQLSTGLKQRLALASALSYEPKVLLLDEPTSHIDPASSKRIYAVLKSYKERGGSLIVVEHRLEYAEGIIDKILFIDAGKGVLCRSFEELVAKVGLEGLTEAGVWLPTTLLGRFSMNAPTVPTDRLTPGANTVVKTVNLSVRANGKRILNNISLEVREGEIVAIIGPNGSGKTTLLKTLAGFTRRYTGEVSVLGGPPDYSKAAYTTQVPELQFTERTVAEEVASSLLVRGFSKQEALKVARRELEARGLAHLSDRLLYEISQGEKRLISLLETELLDRNLYLLDEPTFGLDFKNTLSVLSWVRRLASKGKTVLFVTHDSWVLPLLPLTAVVGLSEGTVVFRGTLQELLVRKNVWDRLAFLPPAELAEESSVSGAARAIENYRNKVVGVYEFSKRAQPHS